MRRLLIIAVALGACAVPVASPPPTTTAPPTTEPAPTTTTILAATTTSTIPPTTTTTLPPKGWLVVHGTGDVQLDSDVLPVFRSQGYEHAWTGLGDLFRDDDLTIINLECSPSPDGPPEPKEFVFGCDPDAYPAAIDAGVDVMNLGNNHSQDHGKPAMLEGRALLEDLGLNPVGAGRDDVEAGAPAILEINGWTVAVVGFGGVRPHDGWIATPDRPGMRDGDTIETMVEAVAAADAVADLVFVVIHWGVERDLEPRQEDVERAEAMVAAGADAIFGHHSHRLNPLTFVDGAPVAWSLGNFVWPYFGGLSSKTAVARVVVSPDGEVDACLIPAQIESDGHPVLTGEPPCGPPAS